MSVNAGVFHFGSTWIPVIKVNPNPLYHPPVVPAADVLYSVARDPLLYRPLMRPTGFTIEDNLVTDLK